MKLQDILTVNDHEYMMTYIDLARQLQGVNSIFCPQKGDKIHRYEWVNDVPLNKRKDGIRVNYLSLTVISIQKDGSEKITFRSSWVTDLTVDKTNVELLSRVGRSRW